MALRIIDRRFVTGFVVTLAVLAVAVWVAG